MLPSSPKAAHKDRISSLPDDLLCHIISFLPTKYAVGTSILSSRWKYLWTFLPSLHIDDRLQRHPGSIQTIEQLDNSFMDFVANVLKHHNVPFIKTFHLRITRDYDRTRVFAWIFSVIMRNVEELNLFVTRNNRLYLPLSLYSCEKLVVLKLGSDLALNVPQFVVLPNLKVLHLKSVVSLDDASIKNLLSGSPYLEELVIDREYSDDVKNLTVPSLSLERLTIRTTMEENEEIDPFEVVVNAPKLEFLELIDYLYGNFNMKMVSLLVKAKVDVGVHFFIYEEPLGYEDHVLQLIRQISNVKVLCLSFFAASALFCTSPQNWPSFVNVTHLEVEVLDASWYIVVNMLELSPKLETLVVERVCDDDDYGLKWDPPESVSQCLLFSLQVIEYKRFYGYCIEKLAVKFLLKNAMVLKKMKISYTGKLKDKSAVLDELSVFRKGSSTCEIVFT